tara:strand:- start:1254 stop:1466 length:213 start_codon:yes stop_codon:yes gene_type:complete
MKEYGAAYIMNSDRQTIDTDVGESNLYRESLEFDTAAKTDVLTEDAPKVQTKTTVDASLFAMADDTSLYG